jgi:hypothetical protein
MLVLSFKRQGATSSLTPVEFFEFRGSRLFVAGSSTPSATYMAGEWTYAHATYTAAECIGRISIQFFQHDGAAGLSIGPRHGVWLRDRFIFAGREPVAALNPGKDQWLDTRGHRQWPIVRVAPYAP